MNCATKRLAGIIVDLRRRVELLQHALLEDGHAMGQRHGLDLVMRDIDRRGAERRLHVLQLGAHVAAQLGIEVGERLVHEEDRGPAHHGAGKRHALTLAARKLARITVQQLVDLHLGGGIADGRLLLGLRNLPHLQRKADVLRHRLVRIERIGLEHHRDVAVLRQDIASRRGRRSGCGPRSPSRGRRGCAVPWSCPIPTHPAAPGTRPAPPRGRTPPAPARRRRTSAILSNVTGTPVAEAIARMP